VSLRRFASITPHLFQGGAADRLLRSRPFCHHGPTVPKTSVSRCGSLLALKEVPRTGKRKASDLVTHGDTRARIHLEFQADDRTYRVVRCCPRTAPKRRRWTVGRRRLGPEVGKRCRPVNARLEQIIGLNFEGFTRAVLLPQGDFAIFLRGDPSTSRNLVRSRPRPERRAGQLARQRAEELSKEVFHQGAVDRARVR